MKVQVERVKDRIYLRSSGPTPGLARAIPGARFSSNKGAHWTMPLSMEVCRLLRERFGQMLEIGPELSSWAREAIALERTMAELGSAEDAHLTVLPGAFPKLAAAMEARKYQRVASRFTAQGRNVLIADQPGLGKTLEAMGGIKESRTAGPYLVVCPKTAVESVWAPEIARWLGERVLTVPDGRAKRDEILSAFKGVIDTHHTKFGAETRAITWVVVHPEMIRTKSFWVCKECDCETPVKAKKELVCGHDPRQAPRRNDHTFPQLFDIEWGAIIADESDRMLIRKGGVGTQTRNGMELLRTRENGLTIALSGTPMRGKPHQLWGTLNWLRPKEYSSYWSWVQTYYETEKGAYGGMTIGRLRDDREEALYRSLSTVMLRRTKAEVAKDMPPKTYVGTGSAVGLPDMHGIFLEMEPTQQKAYQQMMERSVAELEGGDLNAIGILAEMTRMKQFAITSGAMLRDEFIPVLPSNKFNYVLQWMEENGYPEDPQGKLVVVSQFTSVLNLFNDALNEAYAKSKAWRQFGSAMLTGQVTGLARAEAITRFNGEVGSPTPHALFLNTKAGGVAITLDTADDMMLLDETWIPDDQEQVEDRIHRVSRPRPVFYHYLRSVGSIDEHIARVTAEREDATKEQLDGRRGVEFARRVLEVARG